MFAEQGTLDAAEEETSHTSSRSMYGYNKWVYIHPHALSPPHSVFLVGGARLGRVTTTYSTRCPHHESEASHATLPWYRLQMASAFLSAYIPPGQASPTQQSLEMEKDEGWSKGEREGEGWQGGWRGRDTCCSGPLTLKEMACS